EHRLVPGPPEEVPARPGAPGDGSGDRGGPAEVTKRETSGAPAPRSFVAQWYSVPPLRSRYSKLIALRITRSKTLVGVAAERSRTGVMTTPSRPLNLPALSGGHSVVGPETCSSTASLLNVPR